MKMSDVFDGEVIQDGDTILANGYGELADFSGYKKEARYVAHAVNSHDKLTDINKKLLVALCDIQGMCIGDIAMGYKLDPESIGMMIYEATGMTHPELSAKLNQEGEG
ncbi:hypothetical protein NVP1106O_09 [Vibrio phage 1.106.O._10N.286.51.F7]|nr:hypothetical protein NVP1106O_09 [Vibrio phage 1.106.O._10N.286.51.F7]